MLRCLFSKVIAQTSQAKCRGFRIDVARFALIHVISTYSANSDATSFFSFLSKASLTVKSRSRSKPVGMNTTLILWYARWSSTLTHRCSWQMSHNTSPGDLPENQAQLAPLMYAAWAPCSQTLALSPPWTNGLGEWSTVHWVVSLQERWQRSFFLHKWFKKAVP